MLDLYVGGNMTWTALRVMFSAGLPCTYKGGYSSRWGHYSRPLCEEANLSRGLTSLVGPLEKGDLEEKLNFGRRFAKKAFSIEIRKRKIWCAGLRQARPLIVDIYMRHNGTLYLLLAMPRTWGPVQLDLVLCDACLLK